ncbi:hypothetical protein Tco_0512001 [Tanacetum coccineum]
MIGTLMYLTSSRPDLVFAVCMYASGIGHLPKRVTCGLREYFDYLRGTINMVMWYSKDSCIALIAFADADHAVQGEDFTEVPDDESSLTFLINLGYKGPLHKHPIHVCGQCINHGYLAAIFIKCLSSKDASNDMLRKSRIDILWGMFYRENIDYSELIWEDFTFQIDHRIEKQRRLDQSQKLKGIQTLTPKEYLTADMMQSLKASRKTNISQSLTGGSSEGN